MTEANAHVLDQANESLNIARCSGPTAAAGHSEGGADMDSRSPAAPTVPSNSDASAQAAFQRTAEERSESEGMREHPLKAADPVAWQARRSVEGAPHRTAAPAAAPRGRARALLAEDTDLERRVLAHERILQALIAHMAETEPKFLERLNEKFSEPMRMVRNEQDYTDTDAYAEEFIRAVVRLGQKSVGSAVAPAKAAPSKSRPPVPVRAGQTLLPAFPRVQVREQSGIWEVTADGRFHGQYLKEEHAFAAAKALMP